MAVNVPTTAFEAFVKEGKYNIMKQQEAFLKQAKGHLRTELEQYSIKRHEFPEQNMVAKFVAKEIRETDQTGLLNDLFDYVRAESSLSLISIDPKLVKESDVVEMFEPFRLPSTSYVRPYLNKVGKSFLDTQDYLFGGQSIDELLLEIKEVDLKHKKSLDEYEKVKRLFDHKDYEKLLKFKTTVGSMSRIAHSPSWDVAALYKTYGEELLKEFGKVDLAKVDEWVLMGIVPRSVITRNRTVKDIQLDFIVMELDVEKRIMGIQRNRRSNLSLIRYA